MTGASPSRDHRKEDPSYCHPTQNPIPLRTRLYLAEVSTLAVQELDDEGGTLVVVVLMFRAQYVV